jgi:peptidoglycan/LPS O-acetylase OafA/YrhL
MRKIYRPEIDGVRAIAVLGVLIYHAGFSLGGSSILRGGFLGVDLFFVISGYLITSIIRDELKENKFSFLRFYERRARRILPALFVVFIFSSIFSWMYLLPTAFREYSQSMLASLVFLSNVFFLRESVSYGAEASEMLPLLHTWSLSVEEQFYIIFPVFLFFVTKFFKRYLIAILVFLWLTSIVLAHIGSQIYPEAAFYMLPTRMWELLTGSLIGLLHLDSKSFSAKAEKWMPVIGVFLIVWSFIFMGEGFVMPSLWSLIPISGISLVIVFTRSNDGNLVTRILEARPMLLIGLASYSIYLWHFPIFSFSKLVAVNPLTNPDRGWLLLISLVMGFLSWRFVERYTRNRQTLTVKRFSLLSAAFTIMLGSVAIFGSYTNGYPERFNGVMKQIAMLNMERDNIRQESRYCSNYKEGSKPCVFQGDNSQGGNVYTVGDSHMRALDPVMLEFSGSYDRFTPLTRSGCLQFLGLERVSLGRIGGCTSKHNRWRLDEILKSNNQIVLLGGRLPLQIENSRFNNREGGVEAGEDSPRMVESISTIDTPASLETIKQTFRGMVGELVDAGAIVVIIYPVPEVGWNVPRQLSNRFRTSNEEDGWLKYPRLSTSYKVFKERTSRAYEVYDNIPSTIDNVIRVYPEDVFCDKQRCYTHNSDIIFYKDDNHLSYEGGKILVSSIFQAVEDMRAERYKLGLP